MSGPGPCTFTLKKEVSGFVFRYLYYAFYRADIVDIFRFNSRHAF